MVSSGGNDVKAWLSAEIGMCLLLPFFSPSQESLSCLGPWLHPPFLLPVGGKEEEALNLPTFVFSFEPPHSRVICVW